MPVAESGDRWARRSREAAEQAMQEWPAGGHYMDGEPYDGITHLVREVRFVSDWVEVPE